MDITSEQEVALAKPKIQNRLESLGFKTAAAHIVKLAEKKRKMMVAYEHYRFVTEQNIATFNQNLYSKTRTKMGDYKTLSFTSVADYEMCPPESVLTSLETAILRKCFDKFYVAHIMEVKDPILFGKIDECPDYFYIDAWDDDVKITDLLKDNEG